MAQLKFQMKCSIRSPSPVTGTFSTVFLAIFLHIGGLNIEIMMAA